MASRRRPERGSADTAPDEIRLMLLDDWREPGDDSVGPAFRRWCDAGRDWCEEHHVDYAELRGWPRWQGGGAGRG